MKIIGVDTEIPNMVVGCDPGPEHCALILVEHSENGFNICGGCYPTWQEIMTKGSSVNEVIPFGRHFVFAYEKVTTRYGAVPGATTYDTCRNAGVCVARFSQLADAVYALGTVDWRVALGGRTNLKDSEVRAELINILGKTGEGVIGAIAKRYKDAYKLDKPIGCHLRDAAGVAIGAFLMKRHGTSVKEREVWHV